MIDSQRARDAHISALRDLKDLLSKDPNARSSVLGYLEALTDVYRVQIGSCATDDLVSTQARIRQLVAMHAELTR